MGGCGAVHYDLLAHISPRWFESADDVQTWVDWDADVGGVGGNLAVHLHAMRKNFVLVAITGDDTLGDLILQELEKKIPIENVRRVAIAGSRSGNVVLLYLD